MRGVHLFADTVAGSPQELGDRLHHAGGNDMLDVLRGGGMPGFASPTPVAQIGSSVPLNGGQQPRGAAVCNTSGGQTSLGRVQLTTALLFLGAVAALVLLNHAGFKFSATVG